MPAAAASTSGDASRSAVHAAAASSPASADPTTKTVTVPRGLGSAATSTLSKPPTASGRRKSSSCSYAEMRVYRSDDVVPAGRSIHFACCVRHCVICTDTGWWVISCIEMPSSDAWEGAVSEGADPTPALAVCAGADAEPTTLGESVGAHPTSSTASAAQTIVAGVRRREGMHRPYEPDGTHPVTEPYRRSSRASRFGIGAWRPARIDGYIRSNEPARPPGRAP
ncbi:exported hypothetical protein [Pseudoclavibacter sp. 8L]|nr:exported hypothetical protein [Pseudoclavibacter sp. 8L]